MITIPLKSKSDIHLARKLWHFTGVVLIAVLYHNLSRQEAIVALIAAATLSLVVDLIRLRSPKVNEIVMSSFRWIVRDCEKDRFAGTTYLLIGVLIIVVFFPVSIVKLSLLFLALADPTASYFGVRYGRDKLFGEKSLQGTMAAFFVCTLVSAGYFFMTNMMVERILLVSLLAGISGALAEAIPIGKIDDNFLLPIVSSILLWIIYSLFGGF
jgi:diacylglycerol kinase (CTP)